MKPTWWQLYGIGALLVALIGLIEADLSAGALRTTFDRRRAKSRAIRLWRLQIAMSTNAKMTISGRDWARRAGAGRLDAVGDAMTPSR